MKSSSNAILSIVTVSFGHETQVRKLWESLQKFPPSKAWELVVVDNNSPALARNAYTFLQTDPHAHLIRLKKNVGFGRGNEEGVRFAQGEFLAFVNPDIEVQQRCFDSLLSALEKDKNIGIAVPVLETKDKKFLENTWDFPTFWGLVGRRVWKKRMPQPRENPKEVHWAQGSFLVMRKDFFEKLGGFDPRFFLFFEDTDLCRRVWEAGKKVVQIPTARAFHTEYRLSGGHIFTAIFKRTFWIHLSSAVKYFWKYRKNKKEERRKNFSFFSLLFFFLLF